MILVNSAAHSKIGDLVDEEREVAAVAAAMPFLWRRTEQSSWSQIWRLPRWMYRGYTKANAGDLAAAVAYHALVAMVPMFFLLVGVAGLFLRNDAVLKQAIETLNVLFPSSEGSADAFRAALEARRNSGLISLVSLVGFAWVGTGLVSSLARGMNRIYGVRNASYVLEKQRGFVIIFLFLVFFFISALASILPTILLIRDLPEALDKLLLSSTFNRVTAYVIAFVSAWMLFFVIYRIVPNARQDFIDVQPGTFAASLIFVGLTQIFPLYIEMVGGVNRYGRLLGLVSLIVAALYFLAHIILFGSYINVTWQRRRRRRRQEKRMRSGSQASAAPGTPAPPDA
jgi:membrane protein